MSTHLARTRRRTYPTLTTGQRNKPSAEGRVPRTLSEAFPQYPGFGYEEPSRSTKALDVLAVIAAVAMFGAMAKFGFDYIFGGSL